jgi:pyridoxine 4-dehydrogenase
MVSTRSGMCGKWGLATWDPRHLVAVIEQSAPGIQPDALLLRAGLSVAAPILSAAEWLCRVLDVAPQWCWGMSPFGGSAADPAWSAVDLRAFLAADADCSTPQAAFRLAYELPRVARVAVGTSNPAHLRNWSPPLSCRSATRRSAAIVR